MRTCARCGKRRAAKFYTGPRGRVCSTCRASAASQRNHARRVRATYGITGEEYEALLAHQGGTCAICHEVRRYRLNVDHDHKVEKQRGARASVRGLLCRRCNKLLRDARDDALLLYSASIYLRAWPAEGVIT